MMTLVQQTTTVLSGRSTGSQKMERSLRLLARQRKRGMHTGSAERRRSLAPMQALNHVHCRAIAHGQKHCETQSPQYLSPCCHNSMTQKLGKDQHKKAQILLAPPTHAKPTHERRRILLRMLDPMRPCSARMALSTGARPWRWALGWV